MHRLIAVAGAGAAACLLAAAPSSAAPATTGCGTGFGLGALTADEVLALPRTQAAIARGIVTPARVRAIVAATDRNANGRVCVKVPAGMVVSSRPDADVVVNLVDDSAVRAR